MMQKREKEIGKKQQIGKEQHRKQKTHCRIGFRILYEYSLCIFHENHERVSSAHLRRQRAAAESIYS